jgi:integrase
MKNYTLLVIITIKYYMRSKQSVEKESKFRELSENRSHSESTVILYGLALQKYSNFTNKTLDELIAEADLEEDSGIRIRDRKLKKYLIDFKIYLREKEKYSPNYVNNLLAMVKSFYTEYEIELPRTFSRKSRKDKKHEVYEDLPTMNDIKLAIAYSNSTYKSVILLGLSSGMSRAEICSLTFKHFYDSVGLKKYPKTLEELFDKINEFDKIVPLWHIHRVKTGKPYFTFCSQEALKAIFDYLKELQRKYPAYCPLTTDKLFRTYNKPINPSSVTAMFMRINKRAGLKKVNNRILVRPHTLRKFFATTLEKNKIPHLMSRAMLGHTIDNTTSAYFKADPEAVKDEYIQIINHLTTQEIKVKTVTTEGYDQLLKDSKNKDDKLAAMEKRIELMDNMLKDMMEKQLNNKQSTKE